MQELIKTSEYNKWGIEAQYDELLEARKTIESQAAEIGVLKIAHEAHQTNNLKMLAVLKKQNAEIENTRSCVIRWLL